MLNEFEQGIRDAVGAGGLHAADIHTVQVNVGLKCDLACSHCHVASSPQRPEQMSWETMEHVLAAARRAGARAIDVTGGAPELNPQFRRFVTEAGDAGFEVMIRTNLTVLFEPGQEDTAAFYRDRAVHLVASLPCYLEENVDGQRGDGVYDKSIRALRQLNALGYGTHDPLQLDLVYNPIGPALPPDQTSLEADYQRELSQSFGITFNRLLTITNMPIGRFWGNLKKDNRHRDYCRLLRESYNPATVPGLMCRHQVSVGWDGTLFDCDFNLALRLPVDNGMPTHIRDFDPATFARRRIVTADHCFGCTAGHGSSCAGALSSS